MCCRKLDIKYPLYGKQSSYSGRLVLTRQQVPQTCLLPRCTCHLYWETTNERSPNICGSCSRSKAETRFCFVELKYGHLKQFHCALMCCRKLDIKYPLCCKQSSYSGRLVLTDNKRHRRVRYHGVRAICIGRQRMNAHQIYAEAVVDQKLKQ